MNQELDETWFYFNIIHYADFDKRRLYLDIEPISDKKWFYQTGHNAFLQLVKLNGKFTKLVNTRLSNNSETGFTEGK